MVVSKKFDDLDCTELREVAKHVLEMSFMKFDNVDVLKRSFVLVVADKSGNVLFVDFIIDNDSKQIHIKYLHKAISKALTFVESDQTIHLNKSEGALSLESGLIVAISGPMEDTEFYSSIAGRIAWKMKWMTVMESRNLARRNQTFNLAVAFG
jgi:hypothetical protein